MVDVHATEDLRGSRYRSRKAHNYRSSTAARFVQSPRSVLCDRTHSTSAWFPQHTHAQVCNQRLSLSLSRLPRFLVWYAPRDARGLFEEGYFLAQNASKAEGETHLRLLLVPTATGSRHKEGDASRMRCVCLRRSVVFPSRPDWCDHRIIGLERGKEEF